jgi:cell division protein FtsQ
MPAAVRGAGRSIAKARSKSSASPHKSRGGAKPAAPPRFGLAIPPKVIALLVGVALVGIVAIVALADHRAERALASVKSAIVLRSATLGLRLDHVSLQGASSKSSADILRAAALPEHAPLLALDLNAARRRIEQVGWVKSATVMRLYPDSVVVAVQERHLVAVWQHDGRAGVVDADGAVAAGVDPVAFASLPLVVGDGANLAAAAIIPHVVTRPRLADRLEALVRVDDRRWDLRLKDGAIIQLPATDEEAALIRLDQLDQASRILDLGVSRIDLRDPEMVLVRPRQTSAAKAVSGGAG